MSHSEAVEADLVWFRVAHLHGRLSAAIGRRLREINLSLPQCDVLATLTRQEGVNQQELAEKLHVTKGNVSGLIDRMVAAGLVERRTTDGDKRAYAIYLTNEGRKQARRGAAARIAVVEETLGRLTPVQLAQMDQSLHVATRMLRSDDPGAGQGG